jgi:hypothetical protein
MALLSFYRQKAAHCHLLAEAALRPDIRQSYEALERQWHEIAERDERRIDLACDT